MDLSQVWPPVNAPLRVPVQCDTSPCGMVLVAYASSVSPATALSAACRTYRPTFIRCLSYVLLRGRRLFRRRYAGAGLRELRTDRVLQMESRANTGAALRGAPCYSP
jgi:hypothetical protein